MSAPESAQERPSKADLAPHRYQGAESAQGPLAARSGPLQAPPGHPAFVPAGDPGREWRKRRAWLDAEGLDAPDDPSILALLGPDARLDAFLRLAEWGLMAGCPEVRATARLAVKAGLSILGRETDASGRAVSLAKIMGLQPEGGGGQTVGQAIALKRRNALLRQARASRPEWRDASDRGAAALMLKEFRRYRDGAWQADRGRDTAPAGDPARAAFWRVLRLEIPVPETADGLKLILE